MKTSPDIGERVQFDPERYERCDVCGRALDKDKGEDFFVEDEAGSHVYCEEHWPGRGERSE